MTGSQADEPSVTDFQTGAKLGRSMVGPANADQVWSMLAYMDRLRDASSHIHAELVALVKAAYDEGDAHGNNNGMRIHGDGNPDECWEKSKSKATLDMLTLDDGGKPGVS
jgi:hypothetical protein